MIIVIDGPAGAGKSSTAKAVAKKLGIQYLDSGALYRALTYVYVESEEDTESFFKVLNDLVISFEYHDDVFHVSVNGADITQKLRAEGIAKRVSTVASMPQVRTFVNNLMREAVQNGNFIAEGRDLGTAVFPDADLKFYMHADVLERAQRRYKELIASGSNTSLKEVKRSILERDYKDSQRKADPLRKAADAIEINTTDLDFEQQIEQICYKITQQTEITIN